MSWPLALSSSTMLLATLALIFYAHVTLPTRVRQRLNQSVRAFSRAIELRFPTHAGQTARVLELSMAVGNELRITGIQRERLELAGQLRDIGLCAVPHRIGRGKPIQEWTKEEREAYESHPQISAAMLERVATLAPLAEIVREHHQDYAGNPGTPLESRILRAVAEFAWLERVQGELPAREDLRDGNGSRYDPRVVLALEQVLTSSRGAEPGAGVGAN